MEEPLPVVLLLFDLVQEVMPKMSNPLESFHLFREHFRIILASNDKHSYCAITDSIQVKAFFRLLYIRATLKVNMLSKKTIWYHESSNDLFASTMSMNRFSFLSTFLTFDDKVSRDERWKHDKFS